MAWTRDATILALLLSGCGKSLGEYSVDRVAKVGLQHIAEVDPDGRPDWPEREVLRVELSSATDLIAASDGAGSGVYLHGDFCPLADRYRLSITGPFPDDRAIFYNRRETVLGNTMQVDMDTRHPVRDARGRYHYTAYLRIDGTIEAYRSAQERRDICLQIDHPGYYVTPSQSTMFVLHAADVAAALAPPSKR